MKGIYLTAEGKKEIEAKIAELEKFAIHKGDTSPRIIMLKEILSSAIILPVEEDWNDVYDCIYSCKSNYPNGVIIKLKE
jgi:hypothetical protein